jgi:hypothetical protein
MSVGIGEVDSLPMRLAQAVWVKMGSDMSFIAARRVRDLQAKRGHATAIKPSTVQNCR